MDVIAALLKEWAVIAAAPASFTTAVLAVALIAYGVAWLAFRSQVSGLEAQIGALRERIGTNEERLKLAADQVERSRSLRSQLEAELAGLRREIDAAQMIDPVAKSRISIASAAAAGTLSSLTATDTVIFKLIEPLPEFGQRRPTATHPARKPLK